ncbi:hypothetical protein ACTNFI_07965, partial [Coxiella burnetii]|uniref:hypothetical protein n=1 Tax=Coxiella burnetii TaxID=777 RepID=UPI003FA57B9A
HGPSPFFENRNSMLAHYDAVFKGWVHFIGLLYLLKTYTFNCTYERAALEPNLNSVSASLSLVLHWTRRDLPSLSSI